MEGRSGTERRASAGVRLVSTELRLRVTPLVTQLCHFGMIENGIPITRVCAAENIGELLAGEVAGQLHSAEKLRRADQMETHAGGRTLIEVERTYSFDDIPAELDPRVRS